MQIKLEFIVYFYYLIDIYRDKNERTNSYKDDLPFKVSSDLQLLINEIRQFYEITEQQG